MDKASVSHCISAPHHGDLSLISPYARSLARATAVRHQMPGKMTIIITLVLQPPSTGLLTLFNPLLMIPRHNPVVNQPHQTGNLE